MVSSLTNPTTLNQLNLTNQKEVKKMKKIKNFWNEYAGAILFVVCGVLFAAFWLGTYIMADQQIIATVSSIH
jgi:hypothetical protein